MADGFWSRFKKRINGETSLDESQKARIAEEKLEDIIDEAKDDGLIDEDAHEILRGAIDFGGTQAREVMVPRNHMAAVDVKTGLAEMLKVIVE